MRRRASVCEFDVTWILTEGERIESTVVHVPSNCIVEQVESCMTGSVHDWPPVDCSMSWFIGCYPRDEGVELGEAKKDFER